jgi:acetyltransferase-like isoleucine patch superfamily enzyme
MADIEGLTGNEIIGSFREVNKVRIQFFGTGNKLITDDSVALRGVRIVFLASNATVKIDAACSIRGVLIVGQNASIHIGERTKFNKPCQLEATNDRKISLGSNCLMANVNFYTSDGINVKALADQAVVNPAADIVIENHVWIAENSLVLKGSVIQHDSVVAAGSIVSGLIEANSIAAGNPAKVIRQGVTWDDQRL